MSLRSVSVLAAVGLIATAALSQVPWKPKENYQNAPRIPARQGSLVPDGSGVVQYDPGAPADAFGVGTISMPLYGNRFDSRNGSPLSFPGTITQISWYHGAMGILNSVALVGFGPTAPASLTTSFLVGSVAPLAFNSIPVSVGVGSTFFVGFNNLSPSFASVGLRSASTNGQGFHGVQRDFGTLATNLPGQNAMVRVAGNVVIPVELTQFDVE